MFSRELYLDFLNNRNKRPLFSCMWEPLLNPSGEIMEQVQANGIVYPENVKPGHIINIAGTVLKTLNSLNGDFPVALHASGGYQWLEAICGCRIMASNGQIWASHDEKNTLEDFLNTSVSGKWEEKLLQCHKAIVKFSENVCFAALPVLHGPVDILSAYLGAENLAYAFYDCPDILKLAIAKAGDIFTRVGKKLIESLVVHDEGYCSRMYIFTEKPCVTLQDDSSYMISPEFFREFLEPVERSIVKSFPCTVYHMHNSSLHLANIVADYGMTAVQISVDPCGISVEEQADVYEGVKKKTPLILSCWSFDDMEYFRKNLTPQGLALTYIPVPDGCEINNNGSFEEFDLWQKMYDDWIRLY